MTNAAFLARAERVAHALDRAPRFAREARVEVVAKPGDPKIGYRIGRRGNGRRERIVRER
jgi:hypothetical protein